MSTFSVPDMTAATVYAASLKPFRLSPPSSHRQHGSGKNTRLPFKVWMAHKSPEKVIEEAGYTPSAL